MHSHGVLRVFQIIFYFLIAGDSICYFKLLLCISHRGLYTLDLQLLSQCVSRCFPKLTKGKTGTKFVKYPI
jgi:hypothetical protein